MILAFGRLIMIFILVLLVVVFSVFGLRFFGAQGQYSAIHHPLYTEQPLFVVDGGNLSVGPDQSWAAFDSAFQIPAPNGFHNKVVLGANIRLTADKHWVLYRPKDLSEETDGKGFVSHFTRSELARLRYRKDDSPLIFLDEFLKKYQDSLFYINVIQPAHADLKVIYENLEKNDLADHVVMKSDFTDTTREIRKQNVRWLTGSTVAEAAKSAFMTSIFLETTMQLDGDVFVASKLNPRLFEELFRRQKLVWVQTEDPIAFRRLKTRFPSAGLMTTHPALFLQTVAP